MTRSYWERWCWELQQRKELMSLEKGSCHEVLRNKMNNCNEIKLHEIDPTLLKDPISSNGERCETYIGRGSFAVVKLQLYRGFQVAVKRFLASTIKEVVYREAKTLVSSVPSNAFWINNNYAALQDSHAIS